MANAYKGATDRTRLFEDEPMGARTFQLRLIESQRTKFDFSHTNLKDIFKNNAPDEEDYSERVALRTQIIRNPLQPTNMGAGTAILQFFAVNPNQGALQERRRGAILTETIEGEEQPLFYLNSDEVWELAHGGGFATTLYMDPSGGITEQSTQVVTQPPPGEAVEGEAAEDGEDAEGEDYDSMSKDELKSLAEERGLTVKRSGGEEGAPLRDDYVRALKRDDKKRATV